MGVSGRPWRAEEGQVRARSRCRGQGTCPGRVWRWEVGRTEPPAQRDGMRMQPVVQAPGFGCQTDRSARLSALPVHPTPLGHGSSARALPPSPGRPGALGDQAAKRRCCCQQQNLVGAQPPPSSGGGSPPQA